MHDILLKGAELIDPAQKMHTRGSLAIQEGRISLMAGDIPEAEARKIFDLRGKIITAGLIDLHCHPVAGFSRTGVPADEIGVNTGVTLLGDGGSSGSSNFEALKQFILPAARTDMCCFLHLAQTGLVKLPEILGPRDIDVERTKQVVEENRNLIRGLKIRAVQSLAESWGMKGMEIAKKTAGDLHLPLMVHIGETRQRIPGDKMDDFSRAAVSLLERGDILSHYLTWEAGGLILPDGTVYPELEEARKRGVALDSSHGLNHFSFPITRRAIDRGLIPTLISTDMSSRGWPVVQSLAVVMSKFLNLRLSVDQVIEMTTINPARALGEEDRRGSLKVGRRADLTVMELLPGRYLFRDGAGGGTLEGTVLLEPRMVFQAGKPSPAFSGYHLPPP